MPAMPSSKGKVVVSSEIPVELCEALDLRAEADGRKRSDAIARAIEFYLTHAPADPRRQPIPAPKTDQIPIPPQPQK